ncbi:MAG: DUF6173 family protein [Paracoccaceae bacterium]|jgi:hypothetical protein|nr:DUF6173 family protein [Paracoccaceae bacterium]MDG1368751.1 DUF6173 family protein [Paracoccaceae bacterium]
MKDPIATSAEAMENAAMPIARVAHCDPDAPETCEQRPLPEAITKKSPEQKSPAEWAYERIILYIQNFEEQLDSDHEVGMGFAGGDVGSMRIQGVGFFAPDLITFYGADEAGAKTQMVQHVSQLNVMLKSARKLQEDAEPNRIGFNLAASLDEGAG